MGAPAEGKTISPSSITLEVLEKILRETRDHPEQLVDQVEAGLALTLSVILGKESSLPESQRTSLRPISLKLAQLLSVNQAQFPDTTHRQILDLLLGPLISVATNSSLEEETVSLAFGALRNFVLLPEGAVRFMLLGGVKILLEALHHRNPKVIEQAVAGLANLTLTDTVRNLVGQLLRERDADIKHLINMCKAKELPLAFFAASSVSFLLMSEQNVSLLVELRAQERLTVFCERNPLEEETKFFFSRETAKRYCLLMNSEIPEVVCFFNWFVARFSSTNAMVNPNEGELTRLWRGHLAPILRHFACHPNKRIRALAKISLTQIFDSEYQVFSSLEEWLKSLDGLDSSQIKKTIKELDGIDMDLLLDPDLDKEGMNALLDVKGTGLKQRMILSLNRYRKALSVAAASIPSKALSFSSIGKQIPTDKDSQEAKTEEARKHPDVFISYSWFNKSAAVRIKQYLDKQGIVCWMDEVMIDGGKQLFEEIDLGISNSKVIVACVSNNYAASENCRREIRLATDRGKVVIPVIVGETKPWPPRGEMGPLLAGKLYVDMSTEEKFQSASDQLVRALERSK